MRSAFPNYLPYNKEQTKVNVFITVLSQQQHDTIPYQEIRDDFKKEGQVTWYQNKKQWSYLTPKKIQKFKISADSVVDFSASVQELQNYGGIASDLLHSAYKFCRKEKNPTALNVYYNPENKSIDQVIKLAQGKTQAKQWANGRGDQQGVPLFFQKEAQQLAKKHGLKLTVIKGQQLLEQGFRLMHAVGRASKNAPTFINITYNGNPQSEKYVAYVGKGVCFDSGGLDIKTAAGMKEMYLDKHGACSVFAAFKAIVEEKVKINLTVSMGYVQNFLSQNSYRPSDIIKSRKGLTVEIGNTDAEGRLVLADCMHWTQQNYKVAVLIELSTLTGAIIIALGARFAGMFGNSNDLNSKFRQAGKQSNDQVWQMPVDDYHKQLVKPSKADLTNSSGNTAASASQAAAFLNHFVQKGVQWIHLDIAGTAIVSQEGTGYGARILIQYARNYAK